MYLGQEELGRRIRQARDDADLSQSQLVEATVALTLRTVTGGYVVAAQTS